MDPITLSLIGGGLGALGGIMGSSASKRAAQQQAEAARYAADQQLRAAREAQQLQATGLKTGLQLQAPGIQGGQVGLAALMGALGLGAPRGAVRAGATGDVGTGTLTNAQGQLVDAQGRPSMGGDPYGLLGMNYGATDAELASAAAGPFAGALTKNFEYGDIYSDPSYQFRLSEGQRALQAQQAARGNRFGGQALKDINNYAQEAASQEYGNAYNRFRQNQQDIFSRLSGLAGMGNPAGAGQQIGQTAGNIGQLGVQGQSAANEYNTSAANAQAAGTMGSTNALVGGINSGLGNWTTLSMLNRGGVFGGLPGLGGSGAGNITGGSGFRFPS